MRMPLIVVALMTIATAASAQVSVGGSTAGSGSVKAPDVSGSAGVSGKSSTTMNSKGTSSNTQLKSDEQAQLPGAKAGVNAGAGAQTTIKK